MMTNFLVNATFVFDEALHRVDSKAGKDKTPDTDGSSSLGGKSRSNFDPNQQRGKDGRWVDDPNKGEDAKPHKSFTDRGKQLSASVDSAASPGDKIQAMKKLREDLLNSGLPDTEAQKMVEQTKISDGLFGDSKSRVETTLKDFHKLTGGKTSETLQNIKLAEEGKRSHASEENKSVNIKTDTTEDTLFHEYGHHLEYGKPDIKEASVSWLKEKSGGKEPRKLNEIVKRKTYGDKEVGYEGKFINPYVGKIYKTGTTEVLSTGMQYFSSPEKMMMLYLKDKSHFQFTLGVIKSND